MLLRIFVAEAIKLIIPVMRIVANFQESEQFLANCTAKTSPNATETNKFISKWGRVKLYCYKLKELTKRNLRTRRFNYICMYVTY